MKSPAEILARMRGLSPDNRKERDETTCILSTENMEHKTLSTGTERKEPPVEARRCWIGFQGKGINGEGLKPKGEAPTWLASARQKLT